MNTAYLSALSALAGSVVGVLTAGITTWLSQRSAARAGHLSTQFARLQELFRDFIIAASKAYGHALMSDAPQPEEVVALYAMVSRMRVLCSPEIVSCAEKIMRLTIDTYFAPNRTIAELRDLVKSETLVDPLREFSELARCELDSFAM